MTHWRLELEIDARKSLRALDNYVAQRVLDKLDWLVENFDRVGPSTLTAEYKNFFKLRVGDWRVMYQINWAKNLIVVCYIEHRDKIYKKRG